MLEFFNLNYDVVLCNSIQLGIDVIMQPAKPAGLSQHSDTLKREEEAERKEKWEKRTEMKVLPVSLCVCL